MQDKDPICLLSPMVVLSPRAFPKASTRNRIPKARAVVYFVIESTTMVTLERLSGSLSPKLLNIPASFSIYIIKYWIIKCATPSVYYVSLSMILVTDQKNTRAEIQNSWSGWETLDVAERSSGVRTNHWPSAKRFGRCENMGWGWWSY